MVKYLVFCLILAGSYILYTSFPVNHGPGIVAKEQPDIEGLKWQEPFTFKGATVSPKKTIKAEVRVIKKKRYFFDDFKKYAPLDAVVGWNKLSDERNLSYIYFSLDDRKYDVELSRPPIEKSKILQETDLWHLVPSTPDIDKKIKNLRDGHIIYLEGLLVNIQDQESFDFNTETTLSSKKDQQGFLVWVEKFQIR